MQIFLETERLLLRQFTLAAFRGRRDSRRAMYG
jgi:hypothetical protein